MPLYLHPNSGSELASGISTGARDNLRDTWSFTPRDRASRVVTDLAAYIRECVESDLTLEEIKLNFDRIGRRSDPGSNLIFLLEKGFRTADLAKAVRDLLKDTKLSPSMVDRIYNVSYAFRARAWDRLRKKARLFIGERTSSPEAGSTMPARDFFLANFGWQETADSSGKFTLTRINNARLAELKEPLARWRSGNKSWELAKKACRAPNKPVRPNSTGSPSKTNSSNRWPATPSGSIVNNNSGNGMPNKFDQIGLSADTPAPDLTSAPIFLRVSTLPPIPLGGGFNSRARSSAAASTAKKAASASPDNIPVSASSNPVATTFTRKSLAAPATASATTSTPAPQQPAPTTGSELRAGGLKTKRRGWFSRVVSSLSNASAELERRCANLFSSKTRIPLPRSSAPAQTIPGKPQFKVSKPAPTSYAHTATGTQSSNPGKASWNPGPLAAALLRHGSTAAYTPAGIAESDSELEANSD